MTANELSFYFNNNFGFSKSWPKIFEVDAETYVNCLQAIVKNNIELRNYYRVGNEETGRFFEIVVAFGVNYGILFKNVELILKS